MAKRSAVVTKETIAPQMKVFGLDADE